MTDSGNLPAAGIVTVDHRSHVYRDSNEVRARAAVTRASDSRSVQKALVRLDQVLDSGRPLRADVPRGYYINIRV